MILWAPAKVNLYLKVLGKRKDGYHNIETLFERIALFDKIVLRSLKNGRIKISSDHADVPTGKKGLIYRTISLLKKDLKISKGVEVRIFKGIPVAAGLGGGSSDVASILLALNKLWKLSLGLGHLAEFGKKLGSDIPFFLNRGSFALAKGRGDEVTPLKAKEKFWHLIIYPPFKLLSKDVYRLCGKSFYSGLTKRSHLNKILSPRRERLKLAYIKSFIVNDLERLVIKKKPIIGKIKRALEDIGVTNSLVSGSGPSVFSLFDKRKEAASAKEALVGRFPFVRDKGWQIFIVPTL